MQNFQALGALPPNPQPTAAGGFAPRPYWPPAAGGSAPRSQNSPPIANFWLRACSIPRYFCPIKCLSFWKIWWCHIAFDLRFAPLQSKNWLCLFQNSRNYYFWFIFLFNHSKTMLSSSRGQINFPAFAGFEAKVKDLSFEAKDFKMCSRGQGHPRGTPPLLVKLLD